MTTYLEQGLVGKKERELVDKLELKLVGKKEQVPNSKMERQLVGLGIEVLGHLVEGIVVVVL